VSPGRETDDPFTYDLGILRQHPGPHTLESLATLDRERLIMVAPDSSSPTNVVGEAS